MEETLLSFEGRQVTLILQERKTNRSNNQNRYYWGVVIPLVQAGLKDAGYQRVTKDATHRLLKKMFLIDEIVNPMTGEILSFEGSTADLSTKKFNGYVDEIAQWSAETLQLVIPDPNEQMEFEYE